MSVLIIAGLAVSLPESGKRADAPDSRVKTMTVGVSTAELVEGIVGSVDADRVLLVQLSEALEVKEHVFLPIDVLRAGQMMESLEPRFAYRWQDVKAGDTVILEVAKDHIDKQVYCMAIRIVRRPKGRLPASQLEEQDITFPGRRIANDIENGVDVSDEEIKKVFPPKPARYEGGRIVEAAAPGGLNAVWQAKLDAIRAKKKEQALKAQPPEKKEK